MIQMKIYWVSRHNLSSAQRQAIRDLHGDDVKIVKDPVVFEDFRDLSIYLGKGKHFDRATFVYVAAPVPHCIYSALQNFEFGFFENHPKKRKDGTFGLAAVCHVKCREMKKVWKNPNPESNKGKALIPVMRLR